MRPDSAGKSRDNKKIEFIWNPSSAASKAPIGAIPPAAGRKDQPGVKTGYRCRFHFYRYIAGHRFLKGVVDLDKEGFILVDREMRTNLPGVFAAGDVTSQSVRQVAAAVGQGAIAAINAEKYLEEQGYVRGDRPVALTRLPSQGAKSPCRGDSRIALRA